MIAPTPTRLNPYVGPRPFERDDPFYGRDGEVLDLLDLLIAERLVLLYSPSGAGKTSLIQAALVPALEKKKFQVLPTIRVSLVPPSAGQLPPTANRYLLSLLLSLERGLPKEQQASSAELAGMDLAAYLDRRQAELGESSRLFLILDQFEEILTISPTDQEAKREFFIQVGQALRERRRWALFSMREDYLAGLDSYRPLIPTQLTTTFRLDLLKEQAAREAIQQPASRAGVDFTDNAAKKLVDDLRRVQVQRLDGKMEEQPGPYVEPVQLQVVCRRLWEDLPPAATQIVEARIESVGGDVDSALAGYYAEAVRETARKTSVSERAIREWFDRELITEQGIRGQVLMGEKESQGLDNRAIKPPLIDAHLVREERRRGATWFELAHDRLIKPVRMNNAAWFQNNLSLLQRQADVWERQNRSDNLLLLDQGLAEAESWAAAHAGEVTPVERDFLEACQEARTRAQEAQARAEQALKLEAAEKLAEAERRAAARLRQRAFYLFGALVVVLVMTVVAIVLAFQARAASTLANEQKATVVAAKAAVEVASTQVAEQGRIGHSYQLAAQALSRLDEQLDVALLLSLEATQITETVETRSSLLAAIEHNPHLIASLHGDASPVFGLAFSADGKKVVSASEDGAVLRWDVNSGQPTGPPLTVTANVAARAFSPGGDMLAWVKSQQRGDAYGTIILWDVEKDQAIGRPLTVTAGVFSVAFSPDAKLLASANGDGTISLWDVGSDQPRQIGEPITTVVSSLAFSQDGEKLAVSQEDGVITLWDVQSDQRIGQPISGTASVSSVTFSPDGEMVAFGSVDKTVTLWDVQTDQRIGQPISGTASVSSVAFSPDGKKLAWGSADGTIVVSEVENVEATRQTLIGHTGEVASLTFSPDGEVLASGGADGVIALWDVVKGHPMRAVLAGHASPVGFVAFSPEGGMLASGSEDGSVIRWDVRTEQPVGASENYADTAKVNSIFFSSNGVILALFQGGGGAVDTGTNALGIDVSRYDATVDWQKVKAAGISFAVIKASQSNWADSMFATHWAGAKSAGLIRGAYHFFSPDMDPLEQAAAYLKALGSDPGDLPPVLDVDAKTTNPAKLAEDVEKWLAEVETQTGRRPIIYTPAWYWNSTMLIGGKYPAWAADYALWVPAYPVRDGTPTLAELAQGKYKPLLPKSWTSWLFWQYSERGRVDGVAKADGKPANVDLNLFNGTLADLSRLVGREIPPPGTTPGNDRSIVLWNAESRQSIGQPISVTAGVSSVTFSSDGKKLATYSEDGAIQVWDVATGRLIGQPIAVTVRVSSLAFSPDGGKLAAGGEDGSVRLWKVDGGQPLGGPLGGHTEAVSSLAFSPDGKMLASGSADDTLILWNLEGDQYQHLGKPLQGHANDVSSVAFSPDGQMLASGSADQTIILWDVATRQPLGQPLLGHTGAVTSVAFSPDGQTLASGSADHTVVLWEVSLAAWQTRACRRANRNLTRAEWAQYLPGEAYDKTCPDFPEGK